MEKCERTLDKMAGGDLLTTKALHLPVQNELEEAEDVDVVQSTFREEETSPREKTMPGISEVVIRFRALEPKEAVANTSPLPQWIQRWGLLLPVGTSLIPMIGSKRFWVFALGLRKTS